MGGILCLKSHAIELQCIMFSRISMQWGCFSLHNDSNLSRYLVTARKQSLWRLCSHRCLSVHRGRGVCPIACWDTPPWADTPWADTPGQTSPPQAETPWGDTRPLGRHPPTGQTTLSRHHPWADTPGQTPPPQADTCPLDRHPHPLGRSPRADTPPGLTPPLGSESG